VRLCLDEHYSPQIASDLHDAGFDVVSVKDRLELLSMSDAELLATMTAERRALLTENVADFAPLIAQRAADGEAHFGIIYSTNKTMPRSKATIGRYVAALTLLMERFPDEDSFVDRIEWLQPPP
jgi:predicted nuclease of predicted toxin-antitoxin system